MIYQEQIQLVIRAQQGNREALGDLWDSITPKLYGYLINTLHDRSLADDLLQETWLAAIKALPQFKVRGVRFEAWLFAIARNECRQHWRDTGREVSTEISEGALGTIDPEAHETQLLIETVFHALAQDDREILRLRYLADLSFAEIAGVLKISSVATRVRTHRALSRARIILNR